MTDLDLAVPQPAKQYLDLAHHVGRSPPERLVDRQHVTFRERQIRRKRLSQNISVLNQRIEDRGDSHRQTVHGEIDQFPALDQTDHPVAGQKAREMCIRDRATA